MKNFVVGGSLAVLALASAASADVVFWDAGAPNQITNAGTVTFTGYSSGNINATQPQRWSAQAFVVPAGVTRITQIDADWFIPAASDVGANVLYRIFPRPSTTTAPVSGSEVSMGTLGAYAVGTDDPRVAGTEDWFHSYTGLNIPIVPGNYWLTIYADGLGAGNTSGFSNLAWLAGAPGVDASVTYNDYMWRSATYPVPGFQQYNPAAITPGPTMPDATDRWNTSFTLYTVPAPGSLALLGLGALASGRRRR